MPKVNRNTPRRSENDDDAAEPRKASKMGRYVVKPGQSVTTGGTDDNGDATTITYEAGETVELSEEDADRMPWAVEKSGRKRDGQSSRLAAKVKALEAEVARLKGDAAARKKDKGSKGQQAAAASLVARGDNFIGRGEPEIGKVPRELEDSLNSVIDDDGDDLPSTEEMSGGMKGLERGGGGEGAHVETGTGSGPASTPADIKPGQSSAPGAGGQPTGPIK